ncbi:MAG: hypothetical protein V1702_02190 [Candidatus Woesearchaeota archaeon]
MAEYRQVVETEIDGLVKLIKSRGRMSVTEAARELEVSNAIITGWAESLEARGLINMEFGLFNTFLGLRHMTRDEVESKKKAYSGRRESIIRKAEGALYYFVKERERYQLLVAEFSKLRSMLNRDKSIKKELEHLGKFELVKKSLDQRVKSSRNKIVVLKDVANRFNQEVRKERENIRQLIRHSFEQKREIAKMEKSKKQLIKHISYIDRRINAIDKFLSIDGKRNALHKELSEFVRTVKAADISAKNGNSGRDILAMQQKLTQINVEKEQLARDYRKLEVLKEISQST